MDNNSVAQTTNQINGANEMADKKAAKATSTPVDRAKKMANRAAKAIARVGNLQGLTAAQANAIDSFLTGVKDKAIAKMKAPKSSEVAELSL